MTSGSFNQTMPSDKPTIDRRATDGSASHSHDGFTSATVAEIKATAGDPALTEDLALLLLKRSDLPAEILELICKNLAVARSRKVKLALIRHARMARHLSLPMLRHLFTFDLMQVALAPVVAADVKRAAEEVLIRRLETISAGEKVTLARRASGRISGELLLDREARVVSSALENSRLTEAALIKVLLRQDAPEKLVALVCHHVKWSVRPEVRRALLHNRNTPLARALEFARSLPPSWIPEILQSSGLPAHIKSHLQKEIHHRKPAALTTGGVKSQADPGF
jgi:hypothetical protein